MIGKVDHILQTFNKIVKMCKALMNPGDILHLKPMTWKNAEKSTLRDVAIQMTSSNQL